MMPVRLGFAGLATVVQAKRYNRKVGVKAVQEAVASKDYYHGDKAVVVTNSYFSRQAEALAKANRVELWDREVFVYMQKPPGCKAKERVAHAPTARRVESLALDFSPDL